MTIVSPFTKFSNLIYNNYAIGLLFVGNYFVNGPVIYLFQQMCTYTFTYFGLQSLNFIPLLCNIFVLANLFANFINMFRVIFIKHNLFDILYDILIIYLPIMLASLHYFFCYHLLIN